MPSPDHMLGVGSGTHTDQTARVMAGLEPCFARERPDLVVVSGDVNSTLATALAAAQAGVPLAHVESGLRSFDRTMPEELNRRLTDHVADHLFVHCADARENLLSGGGSRRTRELRRQHDDRQPRRDGGDVPQPGRGPASSAASRGSTCW